MENILISRAAVSFSRRNLLCWISYFRKRSCHISGVWSPYFTTEALVKSQSRPLGTWLHKVALEWIIPKHIDFTLPIILPQILHAHLSSEAGKVGPSGGAVPRDTISHHPAINYLRKETFSRWHFLWQVAEHRQNSTRTIPVVTCSKRQGQWCTMAAVMIQICG
jgi:hypothetical protein